jgi:hypothetical protein
VTNTIIKTKNKHELGDPSYQETRRQTMVLSLSQTQNVHSNNKNSNKKENTDKYGVHNRGEALL